MISSNNSSSRLVLLASLLSVAGCAGAAAPAAVVRQPVLLAVLPFDNLSGQAAPVRELRESLISTLQSSGVRVLEQEKLEQFMARHRLRHVGGIDSETAAAFRDELEVEAVLLASIELCAEADPPSLALHSRLVSAGREPQILWVESLGLAGDQASGILGLGLIHDPLVLQSKALDILSRSLLAHLAGNGKTSAAKRKVRELPPRRSFRASNLGKHQRFKVAITPFSNLSPRKNAGQIVMLHFLREMFDADELTVVEPGVVRAALLRHRVILSEGVTVEDAAVILDSLDVDLVLLGQVTLYADRAGSSGAPKVEFSTVALDRKDRKVVWTSQSSREGDDGVFFFDRRKLYTACTMTSGMARAVARRIAGG
jgi:TolB-like protein